MRKIYKSIYVILAGTMLLAACGKDFLKLDSPQNTDVELAIRDLQGMRAAVNGVYSTLQSLHYYGRTASVLPDLMSDNAQIGISNANRYINQDQYATGSNDAMVANMWNNLYIAVANANLLIEKGRRFRCRQRIRRSNARSSGRRTHCARWHISTWRVFIACHIISRQTLRIWVRRSC